MILDQRAFADITEEFILLSLCNHEEPDSRWLFHAFDAAQHCHSKIMVHTVDADVTVLATDTIQ